MPLQNAIPRRPVKKRICAPSTYEAADHAGDPVRGCWSRQHRHLRDELPVHVSQSAGHIKSVHGENSLKIENFVALFG